MSLTDAQKAAQGVLAGPQTHMMLEGGSRSGKTFVLIRATCMRAIKARKSRHGIFRFRFNHIKASIIQDTFPKVMEVCFPHVQYEMNRTDWMAELTNGSEIWFGGLDDKVRVEKVLGREFATIYLNEISQISLESRDLALTRLAQKAYQEVNGYRRELPVRMYYDLNPTNKGHWAYNLFHLKRDPEKKSAITDPHEYIHFLMNPEDNLANLSPQYLKILNGMSERQKKRFMRGEWADDNPSALFHDSDIDRWRVIDGTVPQLIRVVVGVDPSGAGDENNADNDAIGITVGGLGIDGKAYLLEDCTVTAGPGTWGRIATDAFDRHSADVIVGEKNYGGAMVKFVVQAARPRTNFKEVTASRGKAVRAEPYSVLYEQGKVCHVGYYGPLEDELTAFSTYGYTGNGSPNRADAWIWVLAELFPGITRDRSDDVDSEPDEFPGMPKIKRGWMA